MVNLNYNKNMLHSFHDALINPMHPNITYYLFSFDLLNVTLILGQINLHMDKHSIFFALLLYISSDDIFDSLHMAYLNQTMKYVSVKKENTFKPSNAPSSQYIKSSKGFLKHLNC